LALIGEKGIAVTENAGVCDDLGGRLGVYLATYPSVGDHEPFGSVAGMRLDQASALPQLLQRISHYPSSHR
jgi:hypothetical protein